MNNEQLIEEAQRAFKEMDARLVRQIEEYERKARMWCNFSIACGVAFAIFVAIGLIYG